MDTFEKPTQPKEEKPWEPGEKRDTQAQKLVGFFEKTAALDFFQKIAEGTKDRPSFQEFRDFLTRINGILRDIPIAKRSEDGQGVFLQGFGENSEVPRHEDKLPLLQEAYEKSETLEREYIKYFIPAIINAVHLFSDGNGRTSRTIYLLLENHGSNENFASALKEALSLNGRLNAIDANTAFIRGDLENEVLRRNGWLKKGDPPYQQEQLGKINSGIASLEWSELDGNYSGYEFAGKVEELSIDNGQYMITAVYNFLGQERINEVTEEYDVDGKQYQTISPKKMMEALTPNEWEAILDEFYKLIKEETEILIDVFVHPDQHKSKDGKSTLRDAFISAIQSERRL
ncbi:MAG: hypothetical protein Q8Q32_00320 [bacterium]|nr:hypothetical protein [bacterium]